ncbi:Signal transduction histidine kinase [Pedobacter steynii]|jgi:two-component system sensor histidine kinase/response regulator|uniref:histidine kinase n=1 Tax=Pedobacter steynii TaxID=430522 RepID=A0A1H0DWS5_9SPHI|nr:hybrid sensor histidine kinase/response regulator [Pedobacter steynii]NQX41859.1 hybrid sensor histidine kinase/response regulator [Pedobacter steynii]SDN74644.1 Signal transduction histidine kinase [Pedobacter steynii]
MILIVDDTPENLISLKKVLEKNNFEVDTASSGEEALKKVLKNEYVLIILDVQMPGMDGFEVAEAISGYSKARETAIIFLSAANTENKFITKGYSSGGLDYITKPVDMDILLLKVKTFYRIYEQSRKLIEIQKALLDEIEFRKQAERKKDEFISIASHELKTPLTSVKGYVQLLERSIDKGDVPTLKKHLLKAQIQLEKLNELITDLLDISKIESGKLKFNKQPFMMDALLDSVTDIIHQSNPEFKIIKTGTAKREICADEMRIEQVIINFLTNAIKYSPGTSEIHIKVEERGEHIYVGVKDFGIGINADQQKNVFEKFYRVEETAIHFQGLGIGLYISAEIIRRHNGEVGVQSIPGEGSEFYFSIPLQSTSETD